MVVQGRQWRKSSSIWRRLSWWQMVQRRAWRASFGPTLLSGVVVDGPRYGTSASDVAASRALIFIFYFKVTANGMGIQLYGGMD
jgi:hypothetical protein